MTSFLDYLDMALSWLGQMVNNGLMTVANFMLGLFPNASSSVNGETIANWFNPLVAWVENVNTFNVFYFFRLDIIGAAFQIGMTFIVAAFVYKFVLVLFSVVHKVLDSIPIIG